MIATIKAALAKAVPAGVASAVGDGTGNPLPLVVGNGTGRNPEDDAALAGGGPWRGLMRLMCIHVDVEAAHDLGELVADALVPDRSVAHELAVPGRFVMVRHVETRDARYDPSLSNIENNTHPGYVEILLDVHSQPL